MPRRCALFGVRALSRGSLLLDDDLTALRRLIVCAGARRVRAIVDGTRDARARLNRGDLLGSRSSTRRSRTGSSHTRRRTWVPRAARSLVASSPVPWHEPPGVSTSGTIDATSSSASSYWTSRDSSSVDMLPLICSGRLCTGRECRIQAARRCHTSAKVSALVARRNAMAAIDRTVFD